MIDPITQAVRDALPAPLLSQAQCHRVAVAVLRAVREPSEGMKEAGGTCEPFMLPAGESWRPGRIIGNSCYRAMIDTLITELEKEPAE